MTAAGEDGLFIAQKLENCGEIAVCMNFLVLHDGDA
jgi:hypothetical protein